MTEPSWPDSVPILVDTDRTVLLRPHAPGDLSRIVEQCTDPDFVRWTTTPHPYTDAHAQDFLTNHIPTEVNAGRAMIWAIEAPVAGVRRFCGSMEIRLSGLGRGEIAFGLHPDARRRGIATAAGRLAIDWAFEIAGLTVLEWRAVVGNWGSRRVAPALGFQFEGVRRRHLPQRGVLRDCWTASLLADDRRVSVGPPRQPQLPGPGIGGAGPAHPELRLRMPAATDIPRIVTACNDPATRRWLPLLPDPYGPDEARAYVEACWENAATGRTWTWAVTERDDTLLGVIGLDGLRHPDAQGEIGYWTHPDARGRGLTGAAARLVADFALSPSGPHHSLLIKVAAGNHASQAVARRAGAQQAGVLPEGFQLGDGFFTDLVVFARVAGNAAEPVRGRR